MNLASLLRNSAQQNPDKTALIVASSGDEIDYADVDAAVDRVAAGLRAAGVQPGDRVALALPNLPEFVYAYFGVLRAGAVVVLLNVMLTPKEIAQILADSGAKLGISAPPYASALAAAAPDLKLVTPDSWFAESDERPEHDSSPDDLAVLAYTSGTTGEPKGVMLTHGNLKANLDQQMSIPEDTVQPDDVLLLSLPMFHIFGLNVPLGLMVLNAATAVLVERFEPVEALRIIEKYKATVLFGAPPMYNAWINIPGADQYDVSSVRLAISGAAPLSENVLKIFSDEFGIDIYEGYGLTETSPTLTTNRMAPAPRPGSVGWPLPGVEIRLVDEEGQDVVIGDPGEVLVRGPNVFKGYWNKDDATEAAFVDGWFRTGDVAVRDEEGYLYLVDRKRDLIIVSGFNVFPSEVEAALLQNPKISEAGVVGEKHPYTGEAVKAFVVLAEGASATPDELKDEISTRLARFKCPNSVEIVDSLPVLMTGKILRRALRS